MCRSLGLGEKTNKGHFHAISSQFSTHCDYAQTGARCFLYAII